MDKRGDLQDIQQYPLVVGPSPSQDIGFSLGLFAGTWAGVAREFDWCGHADEG